MKEVITKLREIELKVMATASDKGSTNYVANKQ